MLLESTSIRGGFRGVRLVSLGDVLTEYNGDVRIRRLKHSLYPEVVEAKTSRFVQGVLGRPYEKNLLELMRAAWTFTRIKYETPNELFCSELVAGMYQLFGFIPKAPSANNYTPEDFRIGGVVDRMMRLSPEAACLGEEIDVKTGIE